MPIINAKSISKVDMAILGSPIIETVRNYFKDPEVQKKFEEWRKERNENHKDCSNRSVGA